MKSFSKFLSDSGTRVIPFLIFITSLVIKLFLLKSIPFSYDEVAYSLCAKNIAINGGWFDFYSSKDLFFFPPMFNWLSALLMLTGMEQVSAVRTVVVLLSSGIPVMIFLLMKDSGISIKTALFASLLWILIPGSIYYSISGQVETPFIFFVLLSAYFFMIGRNNFKNIVLSAIFLSLSVWFKETAIGFLPVFIFLFLQEKHLKNGMVWLLTFFFFCSPLLIQTFIPHSYDLFFELSNDLLNWNNISLYYPFFNIVTLTGFSSPNSFLMLSVVIFSAAVIIISSIAVFIKYRKLFIIQFSLLSNLVFLTFFTVFPKKFEYYLLPVLLFSIILLCSVIPKNKALRIAVITLFTILSINGLSGRYFTWNYYNKTVDLIKIVAAEKPGATIGTPTPHMAQYVADSLGFNVKIKPLVFFSGYDPDKCRLQEDRCILKQDYFLSDDEFFAVLFCSNWPIDKNGCDFVSMKKLLNKIEKINGFDLYRIKGNRQ